MTTVALLPGEREPRPEEARPYGIFGLAISTVVILGAALLICAVGAIATFAVAAAVLGLQPAREALNTLRITIVSDESQLARAGVVVSIVAYAAISAAVLAAAWFRGGRDWRDLLAWRPWHPIRAAGSFWIVAVATIAYSFAADAFISHYYPPAREWVTLPKGALWVALFFVLAVVMAPLTEELLFRGWLYTGLRTRIGVTAAILSTAALFALAHWEKSHLYALAVFPVGLALGYFRERSNSLMASITFHAVYNGAALAMTLAFGG